MKQINLNCACTRAGLGGGRSGVGVWTILRQSVEMASQHLWLCCRIRIGSCSVATRRWYHAIKRWLPRVFEW